MLRTLIIFTLLWSVVCVTTKVEYEPTPIAEWRVKTVDSLPLGEAKSIGKFKVTYYWIVPETEYSGRREVPLYLDNGGLLGYFPRHFVQDFKKEGVARLKDGRLISYLKRKDAVRIVLEPLGFGGHSLTTLKSVAVDTNFIPLGSRVYIPQYERLYLGDFGVHNGIFYAQDIGSDVKGKHIDIFIGEKANLKYIMSKSGRGSGLVDVYLLK
jgi:3D (Asp-Asp-Asp) domain-containing protein|uniref:3D domain-containing protein n=1 Tax=candidate division WOR-3 bacterium TaxID=2052148 RepID=A0A7C6EBT9_UNCW3